MRAIERDVRFHSMRYHQERNRQVVIVDRKPPKGFSQLQRFHFILEHDFEFLPRADATSGRRACHVSVDTRRCAVDRFLNPVECVRSAGWIHDEERPGDDGYKV